MSMEPDRKRGHYEMTGEPLKRPRSDDPSMGQGMGMGEVYSRMQLNQIMFAKVIGKGGAMIKQIRQQYGAYMKGVDVNDAERMLVMSGSFVQVMDTFDAVTDLIHTNHIHNNPGGGDVFSLTLMIENARAGRLIGQKGSTLQSLKTNSNLMTLHLTNEPVEVLGQSFRTLTLSGPLSSLRRAHYLVLDLFYDFSALMSRVGVHGLGPVRGTTMAEMLMMMGASTPAPMPGLPPPSGFGEPRSFPPAGDQSNVIPLPLLNSRTGLHVDVVTQLGEMQAYIGQFGLELQVVDKRSRAPPPQAPPAFNPVGAPYGQSIAGPPSFNHHSGSSDGHMSSQKQDSGNSMEFFIPKDQVGAVIGKGAQGLRDIRQETGAKVNIARDEVRGMRLVTVQHESAENMLRAKELVLQRALGSNGPDA